jgi:glyoxylase-like metal-dependent hydrolase (beta-lactamase superfamily II)
MTMWQHNVIHHFFRLRMSMLTMLTHRHVFAFCLWLALICTASHAWAKVGDVGTFTSPTRTFATASYWIEGVDGVVMIDTQFLPKEGLQAVEAAERATGKKVLTAIVLHPNPDKFNGTAAYQARGIRVITSAQVKALIPAVHQIRYGWFFNEYAPDYPKDAAVPDVFGEATTTMTIAGLPLKLHVLGRGASGAHVVVQWINPQQENTNHLFVGDLINPDNHAWLELGHISDWRQRLQEIRQLTAQLPSAIHPGRGQTGSVALIDKQDAYLRDVQAIVRAAKQTSTADELGLFTKWQLQREIEQKYSALGYPIFMRDGLAAVWKNEMVKEGKR